MANEKRLIDANELMDEFRRYMVERYDKGKCVSGENCKTCENGCLWRKVVNKAPTVDAVEVVHGRWDDTGRYIFPDGSIAVRCTECGCALNMGEFEKYYWNYCPNCGAKMDGDGNEP